MGGFLVNLANSLPGVGLIRGRGFRPPQWSVLNPGSAQLTSITALLPSTPSNEQVSHVISTGGVGTTNSQVPSLKPVTYFFDAILSVDHGQELRATDHPIQNGASLTDHAYLLPAEVSLEIGMSDAMDSYVAGQWTGADTKSISAYRTLQIIQSLRTPIVVTTRLRTYQNMLIRNIRVHDDVRSFHGLRATVNFREILLGTVTSTLTISARPNQSQDSSLGGAQPEAVPQGYIRFQNADGTWSSAPVVPAP